MGGKAGQKRKAAPKEIDVSSENYVVEKIVGQRIIKGKAQYKVHWAGYTTDEETWENESQLDCNELLEEFHAENEEGGEGTSSSREVRNTKVDHENAASSESECESSKSDLKSKSNKRAKGSTSKMHIEKVSSDEESQDKTDAPKSQKHLKNNRGITKQQKKDAPESEDENEEDKEPKIQKSKGSTTKGNKKHKKEGKYKEEPDESENSEAENQKEYVVERIIEMHTLKSGKREFLVRWRGYGKADDTWEPEKNLTGLEVLDKFLQKVEKVKELTPKELRVARKPTDRFTAMPQGDKRRQSKRHANRQRVKYYDAE